LQIGNAFVIYENELTRLPGLLAYELQGSVSAIFNVADHTGLSISIHTAYIFLGTYYEEVSQHPCSGIGCEGPEYAIKMRSMSFPSSCRLHHKQD
jgi:hypothetical protein